MRNSWFVLDPSENDRHEGQKHHGGGEEREMIERKILRRLLIVIVLIKGFLPPVLYAETKPSVFVSILPLEYFVERIGREFVDVKVMVGPGQSPATYEPTPRQMTDLGRSRIYFRIGVPFEKALLPKVRDIFPDLKIVDVSRGIERLYFQSLSEAETPDPHIWLDPKRGMIQARTIAEELSLLFPSRKEVFQRNLLSFLDDLKRLDHRLTSVLAPLQGRSFYVFHPAFGYFAQSYGLTQVAVEMEGKEPGLRSLSRLITRARKEGVKVIFVQPQYAKRDVEALAEAIGGAVVPIDPLPRDYIRSLDATAEAIRIGLTLKRGRPPEERSRS